MDEEVDLHLTEKDVEMITLPNNVNTNPSCQNHQNDKANDSGTKGKKWKRMARAGQNKDKKDVPLLKREREHSGDLQTILDETYSQEINEVKKHKIDCFVPFNGSVGESRHGQSQ